MKSQRTLLVTTEIITHRWFHHECCTHLNSLRVRWDQHAQCWGSPQACVAQCRDLSSVAKWKIEAVVELWIVLSRCREEGVPAHWDHHQRSRSTLSCKDHSQGHLLSIVLSLRDPIWPYIWCLSTAFTLTRSKNPGVVCSPVELLFSHFPQCSRSGVLLSS